MSFARATLWAAEACAALNAALIDGNYWANYRATVAELKRQSRLDGTCDLRLR